MPDFEGSLPPTGIRCPKCSCPTDGGFWVNKVEGTSVTVMRPCQCALEFQESASFRKSENTPKSETSPLYGEYETRSEAKTKWLLEQRALSRETGQVGQIGPDGSNNPNYSNKGVIGHSAHVSKNTIPEGELQ